MLLESNEDIDKLSSYLNAILVKREKISKDHSNISELINEFRDVYEYWLSYHYFPKIDPDKKMDNIIQNTMLEILKSVNKL